jgi:hypothetical protein
MNADEYLKTTENMMLLMQLIHSIPLEEFIQHTEDGLVLAQRMGNESGIKHLSMLRSLAVSLRLTKRTITIYAQK